MKPGNKLSLPVLFLALLLVLSGCAATSNSSKLVLDIPKEYEGVLVSDASSVVETSDYNEVLVNGKDEANRLIGFLNGKELVEPSDEELQKRMDRLEEPGSYRMLLYNEPDVNSMNESLYPILFYKDGTIQVDQKGVSYFIENSPKDLLSRLKVDWNIAF